MKKKLADEEIKNVAGGAGGDSGEGYCEGCGQMINLADALVKKVPTVCGTYHYYYKCPLCSHEWEEFDETPGQGEIH